jgi:hypothetical protein
MASIFQIRRGTADISSSIFDGEIYLNKSKNSLQVSIGDGNPITLLPLNTASVGNINLTGDITASNAHFKNNVRIDGNILLGDGAAGDTIQSLGVFTTNLVPGATNLYDIGTTSSVWANVYANNVSASSFTGSFSGSILGIDIKTFSQSVDNRLDQLEVDSGSQSGRLIILETKATTLEPLTSSLLSYTGSTNGRLNNLESKSASVDISILNINTFTASINTAIDVSGGDTRIKGNLIVDGVQTALNTTETYIKDKSITLASGSTTSAIADGAGINIAGAGVSMSWDDGNQRLVFTTNIAALGSISASTIVGLNSDSVSTYSTSVDSRLVNLQITSGSTNSSIIALNIFSESTLSRVSNLETTSASVLIRTDSLEVFSGSTLGRLTLLETDSGSQNTRIGSLETKANTLETLSSSILIFTGSTNSRLDNLEQTSASVNTFINTAYPIYTQSVEVRLGDVEYTASFFGSGPIAQFDKLNQVTQSLQLFTASADIRLNNIESTTSSLNSFSSSINETIKAKLNTESVVSGSSQVLGGSGVWSGSAQLPSGVVSGSSQILGGSGIHSGSIGDYEFNSIGVGTAASTTAGEIRALGDITAYYSSDIGLKENIVPITNALQKVNQISGNTYDWKTGFDEVHSHKGNDVGVIAQEIEQILPQIVINRDNGYKAVQYEKIIPLLIEAIKELSQKVDRLENK